MYLLITFDKENEFGVNLVIFGSRNQIIIIQNIDSFFGLLSKFKIRNADSRIDLPRFKIWIRADSKTDTSGLIRKSNPELCHFWNSFPKKLHNLDTDLFTDCYYDWILPVSKLLFLSQCPPNEQIYSSN